MNNAENDAMAAPNKPYAGINHKLKIIVINAKKTPITKSAL